MKREKAQFIPFEFCFDGFSFSNYRKGEDEILTPQLKAAGFKVGDWYSSDFDSCGPLVREVEVVLPSGERRLVQYG